MEEGKEPALAAGEKQAGFNTILNLFSAFTLLMEEGREPALIAGEKQAGSNTKLNLFRAFTLLRRRGRSQLWQQERSRLALTLFSTCSGLSPC